MNFQSIENDISLTPPCKALLAELARTLRPADAQEAYASHRLGALEALERCVRLSCFCRVLCWKGRPVAAFGLAPQTLGGNTACVWQLTGSNLPRVAKTFFKLSRRAVKYFKTLYPNLYCVADVRYEAAGRYVRRLGFLPAGEAVELAGKETKFQYYQIRQ